MNGYTIEQARYGGFIVWAPGVSGDLRTPAFAGDLSACLDFIRSALKDAVFAAV